MTVSSLRSRVVRDLVAAGRRSAYTADADEPDPRYRAYGVRAPELRRIIADHRADIRQLEPADKVELARRLVDSGYGEQQGVALYVLEQIPDYFTPDRFDELDALFRKLHGWSKIDPYTGSLLRDVLERHPRALMKLVRRWNGDDDIWLRRASVVLFTRKVARSGRYTDFALGLCDKLKHDAEDMVRKGVGWCLKDLMRSDRERVLDYVVALREEGVSSVITLYALRDVKGAERERVLQRKAIR